MSDRRKDYGPTGCVNRSFCLLLIVAALALAVALS
jgi:hypothetical protein